MLWCLFLFIFNLCFLMTKSLEDFDEIIVDNPKIQIKSGRVQFENIKREIALQNEDVNTNSELSTYNCSKRNENKRQFEFFTSINNALENNSVIITAISNFTESVLTTNETHEDARKSNCPVCSCGTSMKKNRIVGGTLAKINDYPWMVYLTQFNKFFCGASLVNTKYLLSAAHCVTGYSIFDAILYHPTITRVSLKAVFMDNDRSTNDPNKFTRRILSVIRHPGYSGSTSNNDISLLKLDRDVQFSGLMRPVCLPPPDNTFAGQKGVVTGWGTTKEGGRTSQQLREVTLPILSNEQCRKTGNGRRITSNMMCAGYVKQGNKDSCQGDSGGPMHVFMGDAYRVVGVVSWGDGCGRPNHPGVYTRVNKYLHWIKLNTKEGCYC